MDGFFFDFFILNVKKKIENFFKKIQPINTLSGARK
jgi:hypothetical protein